MSFHASQTFTFGEQPSATKWQYIWDNDYALADGSGISTGAIVARHYGAASVDSAALASGVPVQIKSVNYSAVATGSTVIPFDDTIPQNTEGDQFMSLAFTPKSATNRLLILSRVYCHSTPSVQDLISALFQDSTANALAASYGTLGGSNYGASLPLTHDMLAGTTSSTTFKIRAGGGVAGTTTFNGQSGTRRFGGIVLSGITIIEYKP